MRELLYNEGWHSAISFYGSRLQPDYSVGSERSPFTNNQLERLAPFVGEVTDTFTFYAIGHLADVPPVANMQREVRRHGSWYRRRTECSQYDTCSERYGWLFRLAKREKELHREILAFPISHDHETIRIYGHYPVIDGNKATFYLHPIRESDIKELDGKEKWTAFLQHMVADLKRILFSYWWLVAWSEFWGLTAVRARGVCNLAEEVGKPPSLWSWCRVSRGSWQSIKSYWFARTIPPILPCLRGLRGRTRKSQGKRVGRITSVNSLTGYKSVFWGVW